MTHDKRKVPFLLWPFYAIWWLISFILEFTGRLIGAILGMVFIVAGVIISLTLVGAIIGIPLALLGLLMVIRSLF